ncbi:MAG TPA: hypothetical protein VKQ36_07220 [Ktedonobacterales bacterium]|nr:hypothetical protein [Ktedonobacterales bacterium]
MRDTEPAPHPIDPYQKSGEAPRHSPQSDTPFVRYSLGETDHLD